MAFRSESPQKPERNPRIFLALFLAIGLMVIGSLISGQPIFAIAAIVGGVTLWLRGRTIRS
jgi:hypothetical protein